MATRFSGGPFKVARGGRAHYGIGILSVDVQTIQVEEMINKVNQAVSPPALVRFLANEVDGYLQDRIIDRFSTEGGEGLGNQWLPLTPTTERIRGEAGFGPSGPINERTGELFAGVTYSEDVEIIPGGASITKPGSEMASDTMFMRKLRHAQFGAIDNPLFPGSTTPPRPVLDMTPRDTVAIVTKLQHHVMNYVVSSLISENA
jgi:hypothetical protein